MAHSEVDKARLLDSGDVEISLLLPNSAKDDQIVIQAVVTQNSFGGRSGRALAHTSYLFRQTQDGAPAVFTVPRDPDGKPFDPKVGIEVSASAGYPCWSSLDGAGAGLQAQGWTWELSGWS